MAPTIYRTEKLRFVIYPKDHAPPHVHVIGPDAEAKFGIINGECYFSRGFSTRDISRIKEKLDDLRAQLLEAWYENQK